MKNELVTVRDGVETRLAHLLYVDGTRACVRFWLDPVACFYGALEVDAARVLGPALDAAPAARAALAAHMTREARIESGLRARGVAHHLQ